MSEKSVAKWPFTGWVIVGGGILAILAAANSTSWGVEEAERPSPVPAVAESPDPDPAIKLPAECQSHTVPLCDGTFRIAGDQSSTGITTGWISTDGPRPDREQHCVWLRLSGPEMTMENTLATGDVPKGPATVQIKPGDYAFATYGCQPWQKVG